LIPIDPAPPASSGAPTAAAFGARSASSDAQADVGEELLPLLVQPLDLPFDGADLLHPRLANPTHHRLGSPAQGGESAGRSRPGPFRSLFSRHV
jgi:hypothetical protein